MYLSVAKLRTALSLRSVRVYRTQSWHTVLVTLLTQIRDAATDSSHSLTDALRKGLVLASLLRNEELRKWLKSELEGYDDVDSVPPYRIIRASVVGNLADEYGYPRLKNARYPTDSYPEEVRSKVESLHMTHGVRELEEMASDEYVSLTLPHDILPSPFVGMTAYELWHQFHRSVLIQVLDAIRTQLLELVLDLAEKFPEMNRDEESITKANRSEVAAVVNVHVSGNQNVIAAGSGISQNVAQQIRQGDIQTLTRSLEAAGVPVDDLKDLEEAVAADGDPKEGKVGQRVKAWLGRMTEKFVEGAIGASPGVLLEMVKKYYALG
jgi:hypothetical protein